MPSTAIDPDAPEWVTDLLGAGASFLAVLAGGTSRQTVLVDTGDGTRVVVRHDRGNGPLSGTPFSLRREAACYTALHDAGLPVARLVAIADDGLTCALQLMPGRAAKRSEGIDHYLEIVARLHVSGLRWAPVDHPGFGADGADDLSLWASARSDRITRPAPLLDHAFAVLARTGLRTDRDVAPLVLCHGDAGAGNYLFDDHLDDNHDKHLDDNHLDHHPDHQQHGERVTALVDWEMAHAGDPHDDLASIAIRAALTGAPIDDLAERIAHCWTPITGVVLDPDRLVRSAIGVLTRMVVSCVAALDHPDADTDRSVQAMGLPVMETLLVRTLAAHAGHTLPTRTLADVGATVEVDADFVAELRRVVADGHAAAAIADAQLPRRLAYIERQLAASTTTGTTRSPAGAIDSQLAPTDTAASALDALWALSLGRLAVLPGSWNLAMNPIPGVL